MPVEVLPVEGLNPDLIGERIGVQILPRTGEGEVSIENMIKHVGTLDGYTIDNSGKATTYIIKLVGMEPVIESTKFRLIEIYHYKRVFTRDGAYSG